MNWPHFRACVASLMAIVLLAGTAVTGQTEKPFAPLFDGRTLDGWVVENSDGRNFSVRNELLRVEGPQGWLRSTRTYGDFTLRVEVRFLGGDADSGIFVRAPGPASNIFMRGWPANAYQVQVRDMSTNRTTNPLWIGNLYRHRVAAGETTFDADAALAAVRPTGEWNIVEIDARGDRLTVTLNGRLVTRASGIVNPEGYIGIQGETGVVEFRSIGIV